MELTTEERWHSHGDGIGILCRYRRADVRTPADVCSVVMRIKDGDVLGPDTTSNNCDALVGAEFAAWEAANEGWIADGVRRVTCTHPGIIVIGEDERNAALAEVMRRANVADCPQQLRDAHAVRAQLGILDCGCGVEHADAPCRAMLIAFAKDHHRDADAAGAFFCRTGCSAERQRDENRASADTFLYDGEIALWMCKACVDACAKCLKCVRRDVNHCFHNGVCESCVAVSRKRKAKEAKEAEASSKKARAEKEATPFVAMLARLMKDRRAAHEEELLVAMCVRALTEHGDRDSAWVAILQLQHISGPVHTHADWMTAMDIACAV